MSYQLPMTNQYNGDCKLECGVCGKKWFIHNEIKKDLKAGKLRIVSLNYTGHILRHLKCKSYLCFRGSYKYINPNNRDTILKILYSFILLLFIEICTLLYLLIEIKY